jgi:regulator of protease activity HflC (stomatin/prohibitin superfamily)
MRWPILFLSLLTATACGTVTPGTVTVGVWLTAPTEGERYHVYRGGRITSGPNWDYYSLPTTEQRAVWTAQEGEGGTEDESITFAGKDGQPVNVDIGIAYQIVDTDEAIEAMIRKYGPNLDVTLDGRVRDATRNALNMCASTYAVESIYGEKKSEIMACVEKAVNDEYEPNGLHIARITLNSEIRLPQTVKTAMEASIAASQEAEKTRRQLEQTVAEGEKTVAQAEADAKATRLRAEAEAAANEILTKSITPELIRLKEMDVARIQAEKWNGALPTTVMGSDVPMILDMRSR